MNTASINKLYWLIKREFWEHRGGFLWTPIITGGIFLVLNIMGIITAEVLGARHGISFGASGQLRQAISQMDAGDLSHVGTVLDAAMFSSLALITVVLGFVVFFYCLSTLSDDRRDRSVLFWQSLPTSNTTTVISKVLSATVLAPVIALLVGLIAGLIQLLIVALVMSFHGVNIWGLLAFAHPLRIVANVLGYLPLYLLWALPSVGWLLLCSAWARTKPFLWAVGLPVATGLVVTWFGVMGWFNLSSSWFWTHVVARGLASVWPGSSVMVNLDNLRHSIRSDHALDLAYAYQLLAEPALWIGVLIGVVMLAGAVWLRRWRCDS